MDCTQLAQGVVASVRACTYRPSLVGAAVRLDDLVGHGFWKCTVLSEHPDAPLSNFDYVVLASQDLEKVHNTPGKNRAFIWHHWNRSGQLILYNNGAVSWKHNDEEPGKETPPAAPHGVWLESPHTLSVIFHHMGNERYAKTHTFVPMISGLDLWVLKEPQRADHWCILVPLPWKDSFAATTLAVAAEGAQAAIPNSSEH